MLGRWVLLNGWTYKMWKCSKDQSTRHRILISSPDEVPLKFQTYRTKKFIHSTFNQIRRISLLSGALWFHVFFAILRCYRSLRCCYYLYNYFIAQAQTQNVHSHNSFTLFFADFVILFMYINILYILHRLYAHAHRRIGS